MADHPNAALYERYVDMVSRGDIDAVASLLAEDVVWREPGGRHAFSGREALLEQMTWVVSNLEVHIDVHDVLANNEHTVALIDWRMRSGGHELTARMVETWHVFEGQVKERWLFVEDIEAFVDFFTTLDGR